MAFARVVVRDSRQLRFGTLRRIIADAWLTIEQFIELLHMSHAALVRDPEMTPLQT